MPDLTLSQQISAFLDGSPYAVVGASRNPRKYGHRVLLAYIDAGREAYPVNPNEVEVEGLVAYPNLTSLSRPVHAISVITPPAVTEGVVEEAIKLGIGHIWMQPGAESPLAMTRAREAGVNLIAGGPCILIEMDHAHG
jgi:uncharacterized protein